MKDIYFFSFQFIICLYLLYISIIDGDFMLVSLISILIGVLIVPILSEVGKMELRI